MKFMKATKFEIAKAYLPGQRILGKPELSKLIYYRYIKGNSKWKITFKQQIMNYLNQFLKLYLLTIPEK